MKRAFLVIGTALMLSGCGAQAPDMTEEQSAQVTEYAAGLLMKYDEHHESRILSDVELEKELIRLEALYLRKAELKAMDEALEQEKEKEEEKEEEQALAETPTISQVDDASSGQYIDDFYDIEGISIRYQGYNILDAYPESGEQLYFRMQATAGKKLLVVNFAAKNDTGEAKNLDMISIMPKFKVGVNDESLQYALTTLLSNDLANYRGTLTAGEEVNLVLVAEVEEEKATNIQSISLKMYNDLNSVTILME